MSMHRDEAQRVPAAWALVAYTLTAVAAGVLLAVLWK